MQKSLPQKVHEYIKEHLRNRRWRCVVTVLACIVVFCTTYALILPAITMTGETYCGKEPHTHTQEECYENVLTCGYGETEDASGHTHTDACYETQSVLVCEEETSDGHSHSEACYDEAGNLTCGQEEAQGHSHSDGCYQEQSVRICGLEETGETETTHRHTDDCYEEQLKCLLEEHEHSPACYSKPVVLANENASDNAIMPAEVLLDDVADSGTFRSAEGNIMFWALTMNDLGEYTLAIYGEGQIPDYTEATITGRPWDAYRTQKMKIVIGDDVTGIGEWAFHGFNQATSLKIGGSVVSIGKEAFSRMDKLAAVEIPGSVKTIGENAFAYGNEKDITLNEGIESIGKSAFYSTGTENGKVIHIPSTLTSIGVSAFGYAVEYDVAEGNPVYASDENGVLFTKDMKTLVSFPRSKHLAEYRIPDGVTTIHELAFANVQYVDKVIIPSSVTKISGNSAFGVGAKIKEVYFEDGSMRGQQISNYWFYNNSAIERIRFPENTSISIGTLGFRDSFPAMTSIDIPNGVTAFWSNFLSDNNYSVTRLENVRYNAANARFGNSATTICGADAYFALTVGKDVDRLPVKFSYFVEHATSIVFEKNNQITIEEGAFANAPSPLTGLSGTVYVDAQGVLYSYDKTKKTAKVIYVPSDVTEITIPASIEPENGVTATVEAVGANAISLAGQLQSIIFAAPGKIKNLEPYAMGNCPTLVRVNSRTTAAAAKQLFGNATIGNGVFSNTGLTDSGGSDVDESAMNGEKALNVQRDGATDMSIVVSSNSASKWKDNAIGDGGGYSFLTGETMKITATVGNTQGVNTSYYRLYIRKSNKDCSLSIKPGETYTFGGAQATCYATDDPNTVCLEFQANVGNTVSIDVSIVYLSPRSGGGGVNVWGKILVEDEASDKTTLLVPDNQINAFWKTQRDQYEISKEPISTDPVVIVGSADGVPRPLENLSWNISLDRSNSTTAFYGKDIAKSVSFSDQLLLPKGLYWSQEVLDAVRDGDVRIDGNYIYAGNIKIVNVTKEDDSSGNMWKSLGVKLSADGESLVFQWTYLNSSKKTELGSAVACITVYSEALYAEQTSFSQGTGKVINKVDATVHYTYSRDENLTASAERTLTLQDKQLKMTKTVSGGTYFGEDITYTVKLQNIGTNTWTENGKYYVYDSLSMFSYISPENIERMFGEEYGGSLSVLISNATLGAWQSVTATDGSISYRTSGNSDLGESGNTLAVTKSGDGYAVVVRNGSTYIGTTVAEALKNAGYAVTPDATYLCRWELESEGGQLSIPGGKEYTFMVYASAKDSFSMLTKDWPGSYPSDEKVTITNSAYMSSGTGTTLLSANARSTVKREAHIAKSAYDAEENKLGSNLDASNGDVISYKIDFTHYGKCAYDNLPMVDDLSGSQYLLVPANENPALAGQGLEVKEYKGVNYYVLKAGSYRDVTVGIDEDTGEYMKAATVTVTINDSEVNTLGSTYSGAHTEIKWYFSHLDGGNYRKSIRYQSVIDMSLGDVSYTLNNLVWMNDRSSDRIYAGTQTGGTLLQYDKCILEEMGTTPEGDVIDEDNYSVIDPGAAVTYRLCLWNSAGGNDDILTLSGKDFADMLPNTYNVFAWQKDTNVSINIVSNEYVDTEGLEAWEIVSASDTSLGIGGNRQCIVWPEDSEITFHGRHSLYIYVTLTYPDNNENGGAVWSRYAEANSGMLLDNTLYVYRFADSVYHDLNEVGEAVLQKGVLVQARKYDSTIYYGTGSDRQHYANSAGTNRAVFYYAVLYNSGNKRLYLNDLQDVLPEGFTYLKLLSRDFYLGNSNFAWQVTTTDMTQISGGPTSQYVDAKELSGSNITFRSATVSAKASEDRSSVTFKISGGTGAYAVKYDSDRQQYYLDRGEALAFAYIVDIGSVEETEDTSINTIGMPYSDPAATGVSTVAKDSVVINARSHPRYADFNDGSRTVMSSDTVKRQYGFTTGNETKWLVSSVRMERGSIVPGITKFTESYTNSSGATSAYTTAVEPHDTVNWRIRLQNTGTACITDYSVTDVLPNPYVFTGSVKYDIYDSQGGHLFTGVLISFTGTRTGTEESLSVINSWSGSQTVSIPLDGSEVWLRKNNNEAAISMKRDENGNEVLSVRIQSLTHSIPEGGYVDLTFSSINPTNSYENSVYINQATFTPNQQSFTNAGQGSIVCDENGKAVSVRNYSSVTVSFGFTTSSEKRVEETANMSNSAVSTNMEKNWIVLPSENSAFRYTLTVNNETEQAMSRLVIIDNLPEVGDHSPFDTTAVRSSEFDVNFAEDPDVTVNITTLDGTTTTLSSQYYTVEYSTQTAFGSPQSGDWKGEDTGKWIGSSANARSVRVVITDAGRTQIPAKSKVEISFSAVAGSNARPGKIAWNSFGYHYALGSDVELESMPLVVGVKIPTVPTLTKKLVNDLNQPVTAEENETFRFLIYEGEALSGYDTEEALKAALDAAGRKYTEATVTVQAGFSESETVTLLTDKFRWTEGSQYTAVELTAMTERYHLSGFDGDGKTITFTYHAASDTDLICRNEQWQWKVELTKVDLTDSNKPLSGAVFALYSPDAADRIEIPAEYADLNIQTQIVTDDTVWYLCSVQTTGGDGTLSWEKLGQEKYYLLEVKSPDGYNLPKEPGQVLSRDNAMQGICSVTVQNTPGYALPKTGGAGTLLFTIGGTLLLAGSLLFGYVLRRKRERRFMR